MSTTRLVLVVLVLLAVWGPATHAFVSEKCPHMPLDSNLFVRENKFVLNITKIPFCNETAGVPFTEDAVARFGECSLCTSDPDVVFTAVDCRTKTPLLQQPVSKSCAAESATFFTTKCILVTNITLASDPRIDTLCTAGEDYVDAVTTRIIYHEARPKCKNSTVAVLRNSSAVVQLGSYDEDRDQMKYSVVTAPKGILRYCKMNTGSDSGANNGLPCTWTVVKPGDVLESNVFDYKAPPDFVEGDKDIFTFVAQDYPAGKRCNPVGRIRMKIVDSGAPDVVTETDFHTALDIPKLMLLKATSVLPHSNPLNFSFTQLPDAKCGAVCKVPPELVEKIHFYNDYPTLPNVSKALPCIPLGLDGNVTLAAEWAKDRAVVLFNPAGTQCETNMSVVASTSRWRSDDEDINVRVTESQVSCVPQEMQMEEGATQRIPAFLTPNANEDYLLSLIKVPPGKMEFLADGEKGVWTIWKANVPQSPVIPYRTKIRFTAGNMGGHIEFSVLRRDNAKNITKLFKHCKVLFQLVRTGGDSTPFPGGPPVTAVPETPLPGPHATPIPFISATPVPSPMTTPDPQALGDITRPPPLSTTPEPTNAPGEDNSPAPNPDTRAPFTDRPAMPTSEPEAQPTPLPPLPPTTVPIVSDTPEPPVATQTPGQDGSLAPMSNKQTDSPHATYTPMPYFTPDGMTPPQTSYRLGFAMFVIVLVGLIVFFKKDLLRLLGGVRGRYQSLSGRGQDDDTREMRTRPRQNSFDQLNRPHPDVKAAAPPSPAGGWDIDAEEW